MAGPAALEIQRAGQQEFECIIDAVKNTVKTLKLWSPAVYDLRPLGTLRNTECLVIDWNHKATELWDMGRNTRLRALSLSSFRKLTSLAGLDRAVSLQWLYLGGDLEKKWTVTSLEPLASLQSLEFVQLWEVRLEDGCFHPLHGLTGLRYLDAGTDICSTEEYASVFAALGGTECEHASGIICIEQLNEYVLVGKGKRIVRMESGREKAMAFSDHFQKMVRQFRHAWR